MLMSAPKFPENQALFDKVKRQSDVKGYTIHTYGGATCTSTPELESITLEAMDFSEEPASPRVKKA